MKMLHLLSLLILINFSTNAQQPEWFVYSTPSMLYKSLASDYMQSIAIGGNSNMLLEHSYDLKKNDGTSWIRSSFTNSRTLPDNFVLCLNQDEIGNIWIGTYYGGIAKFDGTNWTIYNTSNSGLPNNTIYSLATDEKGNKWIGTTNGLVKFDGTNWTIYNTSNSGLPNNIIYSLAIDTKGNKWIGTLAGLVKYDGKKWSIYKTSNSRLPNNSITSITIDRNGDKWIGTFDGLAKFNGTKWTVYNTTNSQLPYNDIYSVSLDGNGGILIETWGGGLAQLKGNAWVVYKTSNSNLPDNNVSSLVIDGKGNKWVGTLAGLAKFNGKKWVIYNSSNSSLPDKRVYSLLYDKGGNLWIGTQNGLAVFKEGGIIPLQAELTEFYAEVKSNNIYLIWRSATEADNYGFEIERRINNSSWEKIGFVPGHGYSNSQEKYSLVDVNPPKGKIYYRLKQLDFDLKYKYSQIIESYIETSVTAMSVDNFSNPFDSKTKINFSLPQKSFATLEVYNTIGQRITLLSKEFNAGFNEVEFDGKNKNPGFYLYRITSDKFSILKAMLIIR